MRVQMEAAMREILIARDAAAAGCGMKIGRRDRDMLRFVGGIGGRMSIVKLRVTQYLFDVKNMHHP